MDGTIASSDPDFDAQLNAVLNLNLRLLKNRRKGVLTAILDWRKREKARRRRPLPKEQVVRERARRAGDGATQLTPDAVRGCLLSWTGLAAPGPKTILCANVTETPATPKIDVEGGRGIVIVA